MEQWIHLLFIFHLIAMNQIGKMLKYSVVLCLLINKNLYRNASFVHQNNRSISQL